MWKNMEKQLITNRLRYAFFLFLSPSLPIFFHQARHNYGTHITLSLGVPIETVSRMMGHTSISTTQIYAQVTDTKVDEDMKRLRATGFGNRIDLCEEDFTVKKKQTKKSTTA